LRLVAETIDVDLQTLKSLNPQLLRMVTPASPDFPLHLPEGTAERLLAEIAAIPPDKWVSWRRHRIEQGETLSTIARKFHVTTHAIAEANGLEGNTALHVGDKLIIPATARPQPVLGVLVRYRVRRGDTLDSIAAQFDVQVPELKQWNGLHNNHIGRGMSLKVYPAGRTPSPTRKSRSKEIGRGTPTQDSTPKRAAGPEGTVHRVERGETLWSIARAHQTTVKDLRAANRFLSSRQLQAGDRLTIQPPR
jgi:membrane-bound lytic murein transglycosylase D